MEQRQAQVNADAPDTQIPNNPVQSLQLLQLVDRDQLYSQLLAKLDDLQTQLSGLKVDSALLSDRPVNMVLPASINLPVIHINKFAELNGLSEGVVGGWVDNGYLPTIKIGRYCMVNLVALAKQLGA